MKETCVQKTRLILINRCDATAVGRGESRQFLTTARTSDYEKRATRNETDTSLRNEHNIGLRYRRMHFGLAIRCPPSALATKSSFTPFIRAREAGRYRSIQARHSTRAEKRERRDKAEFKTRSGTPSNKQTQPRLDVRRNRRMRARVCVCMCVCSRVIRGAIHLSQMRK